MTIQQALLATTALGIAMIAAGVPDALHAQRASPAAAGPAMPAPVPAIDDNDIGGIVTSRMGPEAGVWVIAETTELGTRFAKMAVTDDYGRFVVPDLPKATYRVWVRGYGLVNSPKLTTEPGKTLNLTAMVAPNLAAAAQYYPAIYWATMIRIRDRSRFPGTGADGNGIPVTFKSQEMWLNMVKTNGCGGCHQIGNYATRTIPAALGHFRFLDRRLGAPPPVRHRRARHDRHHRIDDDAGGRPSRRARRLDRPHQGRRIAGRDAAAADRR